MKGPWYLFSQLTRLSVSTARYSHRTTSRCGLDEVGGRGLVVRALDAAQCVLKVSVEAGGVLTD